jgi:hypothetical protein
VNKAETVGYEVSTIVTPASTGVARHESKGRVHRSWYVSLLSEQRRKGLDRYHATSDMTLGVAEASPQSKGKRRAEHGVILLSIWCREAEE